MRKNGDVKSIMGILLCIAVLCLMFVWLATFGVEKAYAADVQYVGDADGDGEITPKDVTMLRRYLAKGWNVDVAVEDADVDSDGVISPKDVTMLRRYLAKGWGVALPKKNNEIAIDENTFPDEAFRKYISEKIDYDQNGSLSEWEITTVYELNINGLGIKSIEGIEVFKEYLAYLRCYDNEIEEINLCDSDKLVLVDCYNNKLKTLNLNNDTNLVEIVCTNNELINIDITNDRSIWNFNCTENKLPYVNISGCTSLINCVENGDCYCYDSIILYQYRDSGYSSENWVDLYKDSSTRLLLNEAKITLSLQPQSKDVKVGDTAIFEIEATGRRLSYNWEYKCEGEEEWKAWDSGTDAQLEVSYLESREGMRFRCTVKDAYENRVISDEAILSYTGNQQIQYFCRPEPFIMDESLTLSELIDKLPSDDSLDDPNGTYYYYYRQ